MNYILLFFGQKENVYCLCTTKATFLTEVCQLIGGGGWSFWPFCFVWTRGWRMQTRGDCCRRSSHGLHQDSNYCDRRQTLYVNLVETWDPVLDSSSLGMQSQGGRSSRDWTRVTGWRVPEQQSSQPTAILYTWPVSCANAQKWRSLYHHFCDGMKVQRVTDTKETPASFGLPWI